VKKSIIVLGVCVTVAAAAAQAQNAQKKQAEGHGAMAPVTRGPTASDLAQAASIKAEILTIEKQVADSQAESDKLSGGLIKARIGARIAQMKYTVALLQTRQKALEVGARLVPVDVVASPVDEAAAERLEREIKEVAGRIAETDAKAGQYSGGLIRAQLLSTSATMAETMALLEQRRMIAKYGLAQAPGDKAFSEVASSGPAATTAAKKPVAPVEAPLQDTIVKVSLTNKQYSEYKYDKGIYFDGEYNAEGLDKPARSIKGTFKVQDLFGETKVPIKWTIPEQLEPGQVVRFSGRVSTTTSSRTRTNGCVLRRWGTSRWCSRSRASSTRTAAAGTSSLGCAAAAIKMIGCREPSCHHLSGR